MPLVAQNHHREKMKKHKDVTEVVSDLSVAQKRKVESITKESVERVSALRTQQKSVRDSIGMYMEREGDQSAALYPLFDREAALQAAVSREMYNTKRSIDEVLTKEQRAEFREAFHKEKKHKPKRKE
jgi:Spy/CpxP family protein refolding chaperone